VVFSYRLCKRFISTFFNFSVINGTIRSAFEFSGQKCSACSRAYIPKSLWPQIKEGLVEKHKEIKLGEVGDH